MAFLTKRRAPVLAIIGFGLSALLHGCYDWLIPLQPTFAAFVDVGAFTLFYAYVTKLRTLADDSHSATRHEASTQPIMHRNGENPAWVPQQEVER